ncbi:alpha/beta hydrolase [Acinetobacter nosocomialis]|uniref:alpha/beta hydrolase n=1 Tax=Acinetobacter nosocomialis TaxID=106654 RepID=UPI0026E93373|nr:alpha/beta hydrolase [Acinetobacter nosocomialis]MDO7210442.1 alpha/beta hydrolase [Acinetobacter nosocomialis]
MLRYLLPRIILTITLNAMATVNAKNISSKVELNPIPQGGPTLAQAHILPTYKDISYGNISATQKLDIYLPKNKKESIPVVIYAHPGGFMFGDKTMASASIVNSILNSGYAFVSVNYRLSREAIFPAAVQDFFSAVEYIKEHGNEYSLDVKNIVVYGESAGANIVALNGVAYDQPLFRMNLKNPNANVKPRAVIALYPPVDFNKIEEFTNNQSCMKGDSKEKLPSLEEIYIGGALKNHPDKVKQANPISYVSSKSSPFFLENGGKDCNIGTEQAWLLKNSLKRYNVPVKYKLLPNAGHGGLEFETKENINLITKYLNGILKR